LTSDAKMDEREILLDPGELFGAFRIVAEIGRGNNGVVYLAKQEVLDREVALKLLLPELSRDPEYVSMLMREARNAARLNHPNIVQAIDAGSERGMHYLAMEYVHGRTLEDIRINSPEMISLDFLIGISIQLADALNYAWENFSMTHGDIKPENLLICNGTRTLKLADLGLANISGRIAPDDDTIMATPMYVAPEVVSGNGNSGVCSDIYSFGVMFYELIAGRPPFEGDTEHLLHCHLEAPPPPLVSVNPDVPSELAAFTHRMLEKDPDLRPESWLEVKRWLENFRAINSRTASAAPVETTIRPPKQNRVWLWLAGAAGVVVSLIAAALILLVILTSRG